MTRVTLKHACAVQDQEYLAILEKRNGLYCVAEIVKPTFRDKMTALAKGGAAPVEQAEIGADEIDRYQCAVCGGDGWIICGKCGVAVCKGRSKPGVFRCRRSCGNSGSIVPANSITGSAAEEGRTMIGNGRPAVSSTNLRRLK